MPVMEDLYAHYSSERHHANTLKLGRILEAAFTLRLAEQNREAGDFTRARELIAVAVETCPGHVGLRNFEALIRLDDLAAIDWQAILLTS